MEVQQSGPDQFMYLQDLDLAVIPVPVLQPVLALVQVLVPRQGRDLVQASAREVHWVQELLERLEAQVPRVSAWEILRVKVGLEWAQVILPVY